MYKITHGNEISNINEDRCDLENWVKVTKIYSTCSALPTLYLCKIGQIRPSVQKIMHGNEATRTPMQMRRRRDPHQKQYVPPFRLGGHNYLLLYSIWKSFRKYERSPGNCKLQFQRHHSNFRPTRKTGR